MQTADLQTLLKDAGLYDGVIDGIAGGKTFDGIRKVLDGAGITGISESRRPVAAAQVLLNFAGFEAGAVDGYEGHNTANAFAAWRHQKLTDRKLVVARRKAYSFARRPDIPLQSQVDHFYGTPGAQIKAQLETKVLPFHMRLDWALDQVVTKITLHRLVVDRYIGALEEVRDHYGLDSMRGLGIDRFAGGYVHRKMRGGTKWSMHAYGVAVDHYAALNGLTTRCPAALFCGDEYQPFLNIMEKNGWLPAIRLWGADAMHFQVARMG